MMFNFLKHKNKSESNTYDGKIITDDEFRKMICPKTKGFINDEFDEINKMVEKLKRMGYNDED